MQEILYSQNNSGELLRQLKRVLVDAVDYNFATAFFDLKIIKEYFSSLEKAIESNAEIKFLFSNAISKNEFETIKSARTGEFNDFASRAEIQLLSSEEKTKLYSWIREGKISFRVIFNYDGGIFHQKLGYITKKNGEIFEWAGSANHTYNGISNVNNEYVAFWVGEQKGLRSNTFDNAWEGKIKNTITVDLDKVIVGDLISEVETNKVVTTKWFKEKFNKAIVLKNNKFHVITDERATYFLPGGSKFVEGEEYPVIDAEKANKLKLLEFINKHPEYFVPGSTKQFLEDNISKMTEQVELGLKIKDEWEEVKSSTDFKNFENTLVKLIRKPFDLQLKQAYFAAKLKKSLNFSVPGTGKSMVSLVAFQSLIFGGEANRLIVIAPTSAHQTWIEEWRMTFGKEPKVLNLSKISATKDEKWNILMDANKENYDLIIMHFATAYNYETAIINFIEETDFFIIDEAHYIKNYSGEWGRSITKIGKKSKYSLLLTGTPAPNGSVDINNMMAVTFGDSFMRYFIQSMEKEKLLSALHMKINYADLNMDYRQLDHIIDYSLSTEQLEMIEKIDEEIRHNPFRTLELLVKRQQIITSVELANAQIFNIDNSPKMKELLSLIKQDKNIVIWANFKKSIESIHTEIKRAFPHTSVYTYYGDDAVDERIDSINQYKENGGILIASPYTLAEAVSLHKHTDYTIYFEYNFNLVHWLQSRNRTFRYGMKNDMNYYILSASNDKLEKYILKRLLEKQTAQENLISYETSEKQDEILKDIEDFINMEKM